MAENAESAYAHVQTQLEEAKKATVILHANKEIKDDV